MIKNQRHAIYYALAAVFLWSTVATAFKLALQQLSPLQLVFYASVFSWLFLLGCLTKNKQLTEILPYL